MDFALACDTMFDAEGCIRPALFLAETLTVEGYKVSIISPNMSENVEQYLKSIGIKPVNLRVKLFSRNFGLSILWLETWAREAFLKLNSRRAGNASCVSINFSHTLNVPSKFWYLQGPTFAALKDMEHELTNGYRYIYKVLKPFIEQADRRLVRKLGTNSFRAVANSKFCASLYNEMGIKVEDVIYPPIDCKVFRPSTSNPSDDYVLTYFGKETMFSVIKAVADKGVKIKAFGSKIPFIPKSVVNHPNIEFLGRISTEQLVDAYSNALFTLFVFTHEPFGYIPVESMACGTPTLTYAFQGPSESVVDGFNGWLAKDNNEIISKAVELWKKGVPNHMRLNCLRTASDFDRNTYARKWFEILQKLETV
ncbi:glycosyltransferase [Candidatus Bathyarchaeota archaeon]|nr:glycosyltransferase [Candidatus Bathyarchaeota archaeon]